MPICYTGHDHTSAKEAQYADFDCGGRAGTVRHAGQKPEAKKGYEVDACYDGDSALDWLLTEKYDLLLLDLNLPGRDGMDLLKTLRGAGPGNPCADSFRPQPNQRQGGRVGLRRQRLSGQALSSGGAGGAGAQSDPAQLCAARRGAALRGVVLRYGKTDGTGKGRGRP